MYKKITLLSALLCTMTHNAAELPHQPTSEEVTPWLELKPSYFFFSSSSMREIFDHGGFEIQASASIPVYDYLDFYASIGYRKARGHSLNTCDKISLSVIPFDIGLKPIVNFHERFYYSFAFGPRFFGFRQHNKSPYVDCLIKGGGVGLFANTGFNVLFADGFLLGIFGEYSYEKKKICPKKDNVYSNGKVQIGGLAFGVSLGYAF